MSGALRIDAFGKALCFAALAALGWPAWVLAGSALGAGGGLSGYLVCVSIAYVAAIAATPTRALFAALWAFGFGSVVVLLARGPADVAIGCALAIGICRSGLLHARKPGRALVLEIALVAGGLVVARSLAAPGILGVGLALWGFFLVQSLAFLVAGRRDRADRPAGADPFDFARGRALAILDE